MSVELSRPDFHPKPVIIRAPGQRARAALMQICSEKSSFHFVFWIQQEKMQIYKCEQAASFQRLIWEKRKSWKPSFSNDFFAILTILVCTLYTRNLIPNTEIFVPLLCSPHRSGRMGRVKKDIS